MIGTTVVGHVGQCELRDAAGTPVLSFSVASNSRRGKEEVTTWVNCSFFGERANKIKDYVTKGKLVAVRGELSTRQYETNGQQRTSLELRVDDIQLLGGKESGGNSGYTGGGSAKHTAPEDDFGF